MCKLWWKWRACLAYWPAWIVVGRTNLSRRSFRSAMPRTATTPNACLNFLGLSEVLIVRCVGGLIHHCLHSYHLRRLHPEWEANAVLLLFLQPLLRGCREVSSFAVCWFIQMRQRLWVRRDRRRKTCGKFKSVGVGW